MSSGRRRSGGIHQPVSRTYAGAPDSGLQRTGPLEADLRRGREHGPHSILSDPKDRRVVLGSTRRRRPSGFRQEGFGVLPPASRLSIANDRKKARSPITPLPYVIAFPAKPGLRVGGKPASWLF